MDNLIIQNAQLPKRLEFGAPQISSLKDLMIQQVRNVHDGELRFYQMFPYIINKNNSHLLNKFLLTLESGGKIQRDRLDSLFGFLGVSAKGEKNFEIQSICRQIQNLLNRCQEDLLIDTMILIYVKSILNSLLRSNQTALKIAVKLNHWEADSLLSLNVKYEKKILNQLNLIEKGMIRQLTVDERSIIF